jgi:peptide/nickel transport system substrate-binding protein
MFRWKATATALVAVAALALTGCTPSDTASTGEKTTLTLGAFLAPATLDPSGSEWGNRSIFYQTVFDTLLFAAQDGTIQPWLATEWSYNDDNTVLTLTVRDDVTFTDGSALTADVVKQNLERFKAGTSPAASFLAAVDSVEAPDDTTVVINLSAPDPALLTYLTQTAGLVGSAENFDSEDAATNPVGSGPYELDLESTVTGTSYVYTANPDYWNPDLQYYAGVTINILSDPTAVVNAIKAGEVNAAKLVNNDAIAEIEATGWTVDFTELDFQGILLLDRGGVNNPALADVRVRQAINYAFDKEGLLQALQQGHGTVTNQVFPPTSPGFDPALDDTYPYDPDKARELLADAGYADGLTIEMPSVSVLGATAYTLIAQQLADVGITVKQTDVALETFIGDLLAPKYSASYMALEQNPDWQLINFMLAPTAVFNPYKYADPEVDAMMAEIQSGDAETQARVAGELNAYIVEQAWFAPFYRVNAGFAVDPNTELTLTPTNAYPAIFDFKPKG